MPTTLTILIAIYAAGALFWILPSIQDLLCELKSDQRSLGGVFEFVTSAAITGLFWPLFAAYKGILLAADFVVTHFPAA